MRTMLGDLFKKIDEKIESGFKQIRDEIGEKNSSIEEKILSTQLSSIERMESIEKKFGEEFTNINDKLKKSAKNKNGFPGVSMT
jgi:DNA-binding HxlR family transcriptional regulator